MRRSNLAQLSWRLAALVAAELGLLIVHGGIPAQAADQWVGTWSMAEVGRPQSPLPPAPLFPPFTLNQCSPSPAPAVATPPPPGQTFAPLPFVHFTNQTLRQIIHTSIGGTKVQSANLDSSDNGVSGRNVMSSKLITRNPPFRLRSAKAVLHSQKQKLVVESAIMPKSRLEMLNDLRQLMAEYSVFQRGRPDLPQGNLLELSQDELEQLVMEFQRYKSEQRDEMIRPARVH
jgi:hypothetical protein